MNQGNDEVGYQDLEEGEDPFYMYVRGVADVNGRGATVAVEFSPILFGSPLMFMSMAARAYILSVKLAVVSSSITTKSFVLDALESLDLQFRRGFKTSDEAAELLEEVVRARSVQGMLGEDMLGALLDYLEQSVKIASFF